MTKNNLHKKLFLIFVFLLVISANTCFALEIQTPEGKPGYPPIPFAPEITAESQLPHYIVYFFALGIYLAGALAVISLAIGGIQLIFSSVSPEARNSAIDKIKSAILGLVLLLASFIIIHTINPNLEKVENTVALNPLGSLQLVGNDKNKSIPAPMNLPVLDDVRKNYSTISWPKTTKIINPKTNKEEDKLNCDPKTSGVYLIYWYSEENFKKFESLTRLRCGEDEGFKGKSYLFEKEVPGFYFYGAPGCTETVGNNAFPIPHTQSLPQYNPGEVGSIRIVNGPDPLVGPFIGAILFTDPDYKTDSAFWHLKFNSALSQNSDYSQCIDYVSPPTAGSKLSSVIIYKWAGFNKDKTPNINCSVDLYSKSSWMGGKYTLFPIKGQYDWSGPLEKVPITYFPNTAIPPEEREQCSMFTPKHRCLQSFEIKGNCLVLVSSKEDTADAKHWVYHTGTFFGGREPLAQAFPISSRIVWSYKNRPEGYSVERGTPELENDYITSGSSYFMEIIPLSEKINN